MQIVKDGLQNIAYKPSRQSRMSLMRDTAVHDYSPSTLCSSSYLQWRTGIASLVFSGGCIPLPRIGSPHLLYSGSMALCFSICLLSFIFPPPPRIHPGLYIFAWFNLANCLVHLGLQFGWFRFSPKKSFIKLKNTRFYIWPLLMAHQDTMMRSPYAKRRRRLSRPCDILFWLKSLSGCRIMTK
jgi:hypothetical protein